MIYLPFAYNALNNMYMYHEVQVSNFSLIAHKHTYIRYEMIKITNSDQSYKPIGNTYQRMGVHGPLNISEVGSGAMEE
jgi:hypothetical protein